MEVQDWLERIYIGPGGVERSSRESDRGPNALSVVREAFLEVQERSGGPSGGPGGVKRPSRRSESGREAQPEVWGVS